jgi:hypothetical protein
MVAQKKNSGPEDYISMLLEQALLRQKDKMMENFTHILQHPSIVIGASSSSDHFGGTSPFKIQFNFDIPYLKVR